MIASKREIIKAMQEKEENLWYIVMTNEVPEDFTYEQIESMWYSLSPLMDCLGIPKIRQDKSVYYKKEMK